MTKYVKARVNDLLPRKSHQLYEQNIYKIRAAQKAIVYGNEMLGTTKCSQFQVSLN